MKKHILLLIAIAMIASCKNTKQLTKNTDGTEPNDVSELYVGELYGGGVIFWLDNTGMHGLICSMVDVDTSHVWSNITDVSIGDSARSYWNGHGNSMAIVGQPQHMTSAAKVCLDYVNINYGTGTHSDWYLPAIAELKHLGNNIYQVQKALESDGNDATTAITPNMYWSSTESSDSTTWGCGIVADSGQNPFKSEPLFVRAVRAF